tara:strand:- start:1 stop:162 length:162 start_codon:yes stop_codon:yes gene_type:complete
MLGRLSKKHKSSHNVELSKLKSLKLIWPADQREFMQAVDDRDKEYKIYISDMS